MTIGKQLRTSLKGQNQPGAQETNALPPLLSSDESGEDEKPSGSQLHNNNNKQNNCKKGGKLILPDPAPPGRKTAQKTPTPQDGQPSSKCSKTRGPLSSTQKNGTIVKMIIAFTPDPATVAKTNKNCIRKQPNAASERRVKAILY